MTFKEQIYKVFNIKQLKDAPDKEKPNLKTEFVSSPMQLYPTAGTDMTAFRQAVMTAKNENLPNRLPLLRIYEQFQSDTVLKTLVQKRKGNVINKKRRLHINNKNDVGANWLNSIWFRQFLSIAMDSIFYGYSAPYFGDIINGQFEWCKGDLLHYVSPEYNTLSSSPYLNLPGTESAWDLNNPEIRDSILLICDQTYNLGLYENAIAMVIYKWIGLGAMGSSTQEASTSYKIYKADKRADDDTTELRQTIYEMYKTGQLIMPKDDELDILSNPDIADAALLFQNCIEYCDKVLSQLILGNSMTTNDGSSRSQAEVHKDVEEEITNLDLDYIESIVNFQLIPFMRRNGFNIPDSIEFKFDRSDELSLEKQFEIEKSLAAIVVPMNGYAPYTIPAKYFADKYGIKIFDNNLSSGSDGGTASATFRKLQNDL